MGINQSIRQGVSNMLAINMGLRSEESVLVLTDLPTLADWVAEEHEVLEDFVSRNLLAKAVSQIASEEYPDCSIAFLPYPSLGQSGAEVDEGVSNRIQGSDVVIAITTYSISHTDAREEACRRGARIASMPRFKAEMFGPGAIMSADYEVIASETRRLVERLSRATAATVTSPKGTNLSMKLLGRQGLNDSGLLRDRGSFGNLPAGEAYIAPLEGTGNGMVVVEEAWFAGDEDMMLAFENGLVVDVRGGGRFGERLSGMLGLRGNNNGAYLARRNLAELGIGTNPFAKSVENRLEAEKIKGTIHVAIGDNAHIGGRVSSDLHLDFIVPQVTLSLDGQAIILRGELLI